MTLTRVLFCDGIIKAKFIWSGGFREKIEQELEMASPDNSLKELCYKETRKLG